MCVCVCVGGGGDDGGDGGDGGRGYKTILPTSTFNSGTTLKLFMSTQFYRIQNKYYHSFHTFPGWR